MCVESTVRDKLVARWHDLIADAVRLMTSGEPLDSPSKQSLARRYRELERMRGTSATEQFILTKNISPHGVRGEKTRAADRLTRCAARPASIWTRCLRPWVMLRVSRKEHAKHDCVMDDHQPM